MVYNMYLRRIYCKTASLQSYDFVKDPGPILNLSLAWVNLAYSLQLTVGGLFEGFTEYKFSASVDLVDPLRVGKTNHNVGGLACILGLTNPYNQSL